MLIELDTVQMYDVLRYNAQFNCYIRKLKFVSLLSDLLNKKKFA